MIANNNPSIKLQKIPGNSASNMKLILVKDVQQDMFVCTTCSELEFMDDWESHQCIEVPIQEFDATMTAVVATYSDDELSNETPPVTTQITKINSRDMAIIKEQLAYSFGEMFPLDGFHDMGFTAMTKYLLNLGTTQGKINVRDVLGNQITLEEERKSLVATVKSTLKKVVAEEKLVFSCDIWSHPLHLRRCVTLSSHYIDENFTLHRNVLGTRIYNESEFDGSNLANYVTDILGEYTNTPSSILSNATIVTSKTDDSLKSFKNYGRLNCMCSILNEVVNHSLSLPCFQTEHVCKAIIIRLERQPPNEKNKSAVANLQLNDWFSIWHLFEAYQQYLETATTFKNIISGYEILYKFLSESRTASKLLSSNGEATISTVYLIKRKLIDVMRGYNTGSFRWPEYKDKLTSYAENVFEITDVHRITLFLDPRYKSLKFLSKEEREALHETVRGIIGEIFIPDKNVRALLKLGQHVAWVDANGLAEVDNYLNLTNISPDTNVLEFWKSRTDFPKLRTLAKEMLCIPAVSAAWECYFNKDKFNLSRRRLDLSVSEIDTTLLLNGFSFSGMFDEELKTLFEV
ncbi:uncharacterized protein LOC119080912 isoform X2 [Bradysia coprophila]|nr:uncharacterized protein LOC119080912 isoform X2 [Bradysia coprophila]